MNVRITRNIQSPDGTFGIMKVFATPTSHFPMQQFFTMEDDWLNNARGKSCIPQGKYKCHRTVFYKHNIECFEVMNVKDRTRILIHPGNTEEDVEGCIAPGLAIGKVRVLKDEDTGEVNKVKTAVTSSKIAFERFMTAMAQTDEFDLEIIWAPGLPL